MFPNSERENGHQQANKGVVILTIFDLCDTVDVGPVQSGGVNANIKSLRRVLNQLF